MNLLEIGKKNKNKNNIITLNSELSKFKTEDNRK
jgi:hypothetical protein